MKIDPQITQIFIRVDPPHPRSIFTAGNMNGYTPNNENQRSGHVQRTL
jgi:hypothetical protein